MYRKLSGFLITATTLFCTCNAIAAQPVAPGGIPPATKTGAALAQTPRPGTQDPFIGLNRAMYTFNDGLDHLILKPITELYTKVTPEPVATGIHNFYDNLEYLPTIGNDLLQLNFHQSVTDSSHFLINTTLGVFGFFDVAKLAGVPKNSEDMGLTFARWGWTSSTYVVLPFFGPSTIRDTLSKPIDYRITVYAYIKNVSFRNELYALGVVNTRANLLQLDSIISEAALDPYVFQRNAYLQHRAYLIKRNKELDDKHYVEAAKRKIAGLIPEEILPMTDKQVASY